jgi:predicted hotdog family 3-hydroxylacyl-ACP dehydratase
VYDEVTHFEDDTIRCLALSNASVADYVGQLHAGASINLI